MTLEQLAKKHHVSVRQTKEHSSKEGWIKQRELFRSETALKTHQKMIEDFANRQVRANQEHLNMADKLKQVVNNIIDSYLDEQEKVRNGEKIKQKASALSCKLISETILNIQKIDRQALNMDVANPEDDKEPNVVIIKGLDMERI